MLARMRARRHTFNPDVAPDAHQSSHRAVMHAHASVCGSTARARRKMTRRRPHVHVSKVATPTCVHVHVHSLTRSHAACARISCMRLATPHTVCCQTRKPTSHTRQTPSMASTSDRATPSVQLYQSTARRAHVGPPGP